MKFGQLLKYNMRAILVEKSYTKYADETIPRPLSKNQNWTYLWINSVKSLFLLYANLRTIDTQLNQAAGHSLLPDIKLFQKTKSGLEPAYLPHCLYYF